MSFKHLLKYLNCFFCYNDLELEGRPLTKEQYFQLFEDLAEMQVFNLVLTFNQGVSFGLFSGEASWQPYLLSALALAISIGLFVWLAKQPSRHLAIAVGLIVGGAVGNIIDRLRISAVVDFLDFHWGDWHWPAFNLADSAITLGVISILVVDILFDGGAQSKMASRKEEER